ncbi:thiamine-phosphate pyrophosphorylase [Chitinophaga terrae (ex Kim and Jung 2007)]|uniref:Thiamine-phosphate pyrophosphorylase n=1 Tax=Chitinophaga terrae (ex Kim and Jung 2007) TaxID=408074 RepID=A0A1H4G3N4_9BACT|nr:thiamine phosphate synthase [Chitinophaga terrae (ex Kim and Jung 2007)]MDQ0109864.1 thiamine-phosphate pyrophosphorylase [Chitinophaga terrae (ex Kim and Jung 2007)]GEP92958.1 thiamine phosphate synthase [Chitinophaga terrae (ex Kim and Jung 2007)]SEB04154.1 thiamine-phosphate pyrophosphorylase [Chitinophaga terrae (ex Kim and Jung 2007)]
MLWIITAPQAVEHEAAIIPALLQAGADRLLIRKPGWTAENYEQLLQQLPSNAYPNILVRDHHTLALKYGLAGVHWSKYPVFVPGLEHSRGVHDPSEIEQQDTRFTTLLLSPVFDSISKPGYKGMHNKSAGKFNRPVLALGGIDDTNISRLREWGFTGAALLGAIWKEPANAINRFKNILEAWKQSAQKL